MNKYMKKPIKFAATLAGVLMFVSSAYAGHHEKSGHTIVDVAVGAGNFTTLVTALKAADLVDTLSGKGPFTVFAPTDEAFAALPEGALANLLANPDQLAKVLTMHVASGLVSAADAMKVDSIASVQGASLDVDTTDGVVVAGAKVVQADIEASNGIIHVIDSVILR